MRGLRLVIAAGLAAILSSCAPSGAPVEPTPPDGAGRRAYEREMTAAERATCESEGGSVQQRGMIGMEMCVHPYADAGATCSDSSECEGKCVAGAGNAPDEAITGQCQADDRLFGCYSEVKAGKAAYTICVD